MAGWPKRAAGVSAPEPYRPHAGVRQRPAAPPVYRPDRAAVQGKMAAPPVYRPAPAIQNKPAAASGGAPPVYRPNLAAPAKLAAPAPYRPAPSLAGTPVSPPPVCRPSARLQPKAVALTTPKIQPVSVWPHHPPAVPPPHALVQCSKSDSEEEKPRLTFKKFIEETDDRELVKLAIEQYDHSDDSSTEELSDTELEYTPTVTQKGKKKKGEKKHVKIYRLGGRKRASKVRKAFQKTKGVVGVRTPTGNLFGLKKGWGAGANVFVPQQSTVSGVELDYAPMGGTLSGIDKKKAARLIREANSGKSLKDEDLTDVQRNTIDAIVVLNQLSEKQRGKQGALISSMYPLANVEEGQSTKTMKDIFSAGTHKRDAIFLGSAKSRQKGESGSSLDLMGGAKALDLVSAGNLTGVKRKRIERVAQEIRTYHLSHEKDVDSDSSGSESEEEKRRKKWRRRSSKKFKKIQSRLIDKHDTEK
jgi:hypothetical protein